MNASEVRIGNWVAGTYVSNIVWSGDKGKAETSQRWVKVDSIHEFGINIDSHVNAYGDSEITEEFEWDKLSPIPLSPEILEKAGFGIRTPDSETVNSWFKGETNVILNQYKNDNTFFFLYPALWYPRQHIKYLHQLQNLYFVLTGEELIIDQLGG